MSALVNNLVPVSIEVSASEVLQGTIELNGTLSCQDDTITLVYQSKSLLGDASENELSFSLEELQDIAYKKGLMSNKMSIYPKGLAIMEKMPGAQSEKMVFQVKKGNDTEADAFVSLVKSRLYALGATGMESVPFQLPDTNMGLTENSGRLYLEEEFLVFDLLSGISGVKKGENKIVKIETKALVDVWLKHGSRKDTLFIRPKKSKLLMAIPGNHKSEVKLKIAKRDRRATESLAARLKHLLHGDP